MQDAYSVLEKYFGYKSFRPPQADIIKDVLAGKDVFVLMPTGGGKSLCYQIPSILQTGLTIVVSPLISLMKDQVDSLLKTGVNAEFLNSSLNLQERRVIHQKLAKNEISILYVAPERLVSDEFLELLKILKVSLFAIDEAHCISQWGHDFRPEYRRLSIIRQKFPTVPIITLTATATKQVKEDIVTQLHIENAQKYQVSFNRPNLRYFVNPKQDATTQTLKYIQDHPNDSGIIYCQTRDKVDQLATDLQNEGITALPYHAGLTDEERKNHQERFIKDDVNIIVATIAFGMGIDKPNVRFIIHYDLPSNLERYYQETGRAGRDSLPSECILLFSLGDLFGIKHFINQKNDPTEKKIAFTKLQQMINFAQSASCRRASILNYFGEKFDGTNCASCDNCLNPKQTFDATILAQKILSCVVRTNERFGTNYLIKVLLGEPDERIIQNRHDQLSTFGIITDYTDHQLRDLIQQLIEKEYLNKSDDQYAVVTLTPKSHLVLKKQATVNLFSPPIKLTKSKKTKTVEIADFDSLLFEKLRTLRKVFADRENVPPYIIFSDVSLQQMAHFYPITLEHFSQISGVGEMKLQQYGEDFTSVIKKYVKEKNIQPREINFYTKPPKQLKSKTNSFASSSELFKQGLSINQIAKLRGFVPSTIVSHLTKAYLAGEDIDLEALIPEQKQQIITESFNKFGIEKLSPVKNDLGDDYSYNEIRLVQAKLLKNS